ncbi:MAG: PilZ domain-containing protein [Candidatus Eremiobacterota bacterium]
MFDFIKKMTSRVVDIVAVEFSDGVLRFRPADASKPLKTGDLDISTTLPDETVLKARISVITFETEAGVYAAEVLEPPEARELFARFYTPPPPEPEVPAWTEKRSIPRLGKVCGVLCRLFPGFRGTTHDMTVEGVRLVSDGPLEAGQSVQFQLDLDDARLDAIPITAEVKWCLPGEKGKHFIGVQFVTISERDKMILGEFIKRCEGREAGVIDRDYQL